MYKTITQSSKYATKSRLRYIPTHLVTHQDRLERKCRCQVSNRFLTTHLMTVACEVTYQMLLRRVNRWSVTWGIFFLTGALFRGLGGPPVFEKPARHCPRLGRGFIRPPVCPLSPSICSPYGGAFEEPPHKLLSSDEKLCSMYTISLLLY